MSTNIHGMDKQKLLNSTGNCTQYHVIKHNGKEYITEKICCPAEINTLYINYTLTKYF